MQHICPSLHFTRVITVNTYALNKKMSRFFPSFRFGFFVLFFSREARFVLLVSRLRASPRVDRARARGLPKRLGTLASSFATVQGSVSRVSISRNDDNESRSTILFSQRRYFQTLAKNQSPGRRHASVSAELHETWERLWFSMLAFVSLDRVACIVSASRFGSTLGTCAAQRRSNARLFPRVLARFFDFARTRLQYTRLTSNLCLVTFSKHQPLAQDATLRRITVSNDDGDVYVESSGDGSEIVLKTEKVRVTDGDVYFGSSTVGLSAQIDALKTQDDALNERIDTLNDTQVELRDDLDTLETSTSGRLVTIDTTLTSLASTDTSLSATDASLSSRIDALNATDAQLKATDETLATRITSLNATDTALKGVDDDLSSRIDALRDIYVNELNVTDKQLIVTDATLGSRIDDLNATQYELKIADAALSSRIATLEAAHTEYERIDDEVASLIDALNATDATMQATDASLSDRIDALNATTQALSSVDASLSAQIAALIPPKCTSPGGIKLRYDGENWNCTCASGWSGTTCETPPSRNAKLVSDAGTPEGHFGESVSISGDYVVVGAPYDESTQGSAYVFSFSTTSWYEQQKLTASDGGTFDTFGSATSIFDDHLVIGAPWQDSFKGGAYVFVRNGASWSEQQKLTASDGEENDVFGRSVSIYGDYIVVGAYGDDDNGSGSGSAYVFVRNGASWSEQQKLTASDGKDNEFFGSSVSISDGFVIVGAPGLSNANPDVVGVIVSCYTGAAYVYARSGETWTAEQKLVASDGASCDVFGRSVSISGEYAIIGAFYDDDDGSASGSAYIFVKNETSWKEWQKLTAADGLSKDFFGTAVSIHGSHAVVGAYGDNGIGNEDGSAYVFTVAD